jgi:tryptophan synthase alpha subunit
MADGLAIQLATCALAPSRTWRKPCKWSASSARTTTTPLVLMGYFNPIHSTVR